LRVEGFRVLRVEGGWMRGEGRGVGGLPEEVFQGRKPLRRSIMKNADCLYPSRPVIVWYQVSTLRHLPSRRVRGFGFRVDGSGVLSLLGFMVYGSGGSGLGCRGFRCCASWGGGAARACSRLSPLICTTRVVGRTSGCPTICCISADKALPLHTSLAPPCLSPFLLPSPPLLLSSPSFLPFSPSLAVTNQASTFSTCHPTNRNGPPVAPLGFSFASPATTHTQKNGTHIPKSG